MANKYRGRRKVSFITLIIIGLIIGKLIKHVAIGLVIGIVLGLLASGMIGKQDDD